MSENVIAVIFNTESEAYQAFIELKNTPASQALLVSEAGLVEKREGQIKVLDSYTSGATTNDDTFYGGLIGTLVGVIGGPLGMLLGGSAGALTGMVIDSEDASRELSLLEITANKIYEGETALVVLAREEDESALDQILGKFNAVVMRHDAATVQIEVEELANIQKDAQIKARAAARAEFKEERKEKIEAKRAEMSARFDGLKKKLFD